MLSMTRKQMRKLLSGYGATECICEPDPALAPDKSLPGSRPSSRLFNTALHVLVTLSLLRRQALLPMSPMCVRVVPC